MWKILFAFIMPLLEINARGHYGHVHVGSGHYEGPRGGQRLYEHYDTKELE